MIEVHITDGYHGDGIRVFIIRRFDGENTKHILRTFGNAGRFDDWEPLEPATEVEPTFRLNGEIGRALADALVRHYQGAEDMRALRRDYDAERTRLDVQMQVMADVVRSLAVRGGGS